MEKIPQTKHDGRSGVGERLRTTHTHEQRRQITRRPAIRHKKSRKPSRAVHNSGEKNLMESISTVHDTDKLTFTTTLLTKKLKQIVLRGVFYTELIRISLASRSPKCVFVLQPRHEQPN